MRKMKDSRVTWIGEIPENWQCMKQKFCIKLINGRAYNDNEFEEDGKYRILRVGNLYSNPIWYTSSLELPDDKYCEEGDLLYSWSMSYGPVIWHGEKVIYHYHIWKVLLQPQIQKRFAYYYLLLCTNAIQSEIHETTMGFITMNIMNNSYIPLPSFEEQLRISVFLDIKCAEIDALTADIQTQIDTLEQYKRSVITEAVTKGLNPDAEMKDSGEEWVGTIPASWKMKKGKYLFEQRNLRGNLIELQLLSPTQKYGVIPQLLYEELSGMSAVKLAEDADLMLLKTIHKGDYCISLRSFQGGFEYSEYEGVVSPAYQVFYPKAKIADGYYRYLFKENGFIEKMNSYTMTLRDGKNIAFADFANTYIPYPPVSEQATIADYLDTKCAVVDETIKQKQEQLATIEEYKKSLIFEYVTGKKSVM